jgi:cell division protein FtsL
VAEGGVMRRQPGLIRIALACALLLASLSMVVWRQSRALESLRSLDRLRNERAVVEAERSELLRRLQALEGRGRVVAAARTRLGMHIPSGPEIVILPLDPHPAGERSTAGGAAPGLAVDGPRAAEEAAS